MLSKQAIKEFQAIYSKEFGEMISVEEASRQASNLLRLYKTIHKNQPQSFGVKNGKEEK